MRLKISLVAAAALLVLWPASAQLQKETHVYSSRGGDTLRLDRHYAAGRTEPGPAIVYMFGGGFIGGERGGEWHEDFFRHMVRSGVDVYTIDYRLGMKALTEGDGAVGEMEFAVAFLRTLDMVVEDLFDATAFILERAGEWNIDPHKVVACGSSAGAISVLQGEYAICNGSPRTAVLPEGFNYAGIVAFAGSIFATDEGLVFQKEPCPVMLFHGDADANVPYGRVTEMGAGFFGSQYIAEIYDSNGWPYWFWDVENADHSVAGSPMVDNREEIISFIDKFITRNMPLRIHSKVSTIGKPEMKKEFGIMDYIRSNFGPAAGQ